MKRKPVTKQRRAAPKLQPNVLDTMKLFLKSLPEMYRQDRSGPGLVLAYLADEKKFYGSVARYEDWQGRGKRIVISTKEDTLEEVIVELSVGWVRSTENLDKLRRALMVGS